MWETYRPVLQRYSKISLKEERRLIARAKKGSQLEAEELVLRHLGFVIFRIHKKVFPVYVLRFGEDLLSQSVVILHEKIRSYNLRYKDKQGCFKPVRFASYVWKRLDGSIIDSLKKEIEKEKRSENPDWERFEQENSWCSSDGRRRSKMEPSVTSETINS